jgi:putative tricarboxylic transport membrane protein
MKNAGVCAASLFILFSLIMLWQSFSLDYYTSLGPGPGFLPLWVSVLLLVLSILYFWESVKKEVILISQIMPKGIVLTKNISVLGSVVLFMVLVSFTGFVVAGTLMLMVILVHDFKWYKGLAISLAVSITVFFIFKTLLDVPLPVNAFGW